MGKTLLIKVKYLYVNYNEGSRICAIEWNGVNIWCVNPHFTNKMLVHVNSKLGHSNYQILLPKESLKPITCMDIWGHLDQISRPYNCHCSQIEYSYPIGLLKSNIWVICLWLGKHFQYMVDVCIICTHAWYHRKDVSVRTI
jgi:hypothetical protein